MIVTKADYRAYVQADEKAFGKSTAGLKNALFFYAKVWLKSESCLLLRYLKVVRKLEYFHNTRQGSFLRKLQYQYWNLVWNRLSARHQIRIPVNTLGKGVLILHLGPIIINGHSRVGENCTLQPGVILGQKDTKENVPRVGNNAYFGPGCKVIGKVNIGNNVSIAPNSVVIKDLPDNCVVSGVPAKIIKLNGSKVAENGTEEKVIG